MSELGVFAVDRGIFGHPLFEERRSLSRLEAWLWLLAEASWKPRQKNISGKLIQLERGQLCHSIRFLADAWGWSKTSVTRFLGRLKTETMIGTEVRTGYTVISICNYGAYQRVSLPSGTATGTQSGTGAGRQRDKREDIQDIQKEDMSETAVPDAPKKRVRKSYPADFEAAWASYPTDKNMSKAEAAQAWTKLDEEDRKAVAASIAGFVAYCRKNPTYPVIHMCRYISKRRFEGHLGTDAASKPVDWGKRLDWARANGKWSTSEWGPMPGKDGCLAPANILQPGDGEAWIEWERIA